MMRVLHVGATGNLGRRLVPSLLAHGHEVVAFVRSADKLRSMLPRDIHERILIIEGDANDQDHIARVLREHKCEAVINTAGTREPRGQEQTLPKLVASIAGAATVVGAERGRPLHAWIIGGFGSLQYPGTGYQVQDYMPDFMISHHKGTENVLKALLTDDLRWSLLCVAMMFAESEELSVQTRGSRLLTQTNTPPSWQDSWLRRLPLIGVYLNLLKVIPTYRASYEDVADLLASRLHQDELVGELVGYKPVPSKKLN